MMTNKKRKAVKKLAAFFVQKWKGATENDNIPVNVDGRGDSDDAIVEKVARKIVDMVKNM